MRYDEDHKAGTRARVLAEAGREIRAKGPAGVAVAGVMARAGLTHGGFYAHFASKDELIAETISAMFDEVQSRFDRDLSTRDPGSALAAYVDFYLSKRHRNARERGCPIAALSSDSPRLPAAARLRFGDGVARLGGWLGDALERHGVADAEAAGKAMLAELVGAISLARSIEDAAQSDSILDAARADLKHRFRLGLTA